MTNEIIDVVAAVLFDGDQVLVAKRPKEKRHGGLWEFPGGKVEAGETLFNALAREMREELGIDARGPKRLLFQLQDPGSNFRINFVSLRCLGEKPEALEHSEIQWVYIPNLLKLELAPSDRKFSEALCRKWTQFSEILGSGLE